MTLIVYPNLGAEEGPRWRQSLVRPQVATLARAFAGLCGDDVEVLYLPPPERDAVAWKEPAFPWLAALRGSDGLLPWLSTDEAEAAAGGRGLPYLSAPPGAAAAVHDKAFALACSRAHGLCPTFDDAAVALSPADLLAPTAEERVLDEVASWPAPLRQSFVLKPRRGTSGRGRVSGERWRRGLPSLALRGGAILEPWVTRTRDHSMLIYVPPQGPVTLLGTTDQQLRGAGVYLGNRGLVDDEGRPRSGAQCHDRLVEAALLVGRAAQGEGFFGPCGLDAFSFIVDGEEVLRPVVELNARFTGGVVLCGRIRRAVAAAQAEPGDRFLFDATRDALTFARD